MILVDWFTPGYKAGGPIQSSMNLAFALKEDYDINILTTDTDHGETKPYPGIPPNQWINNLDPKLNIFYARKSTLSRKQLKKEIVGVNADFIYLNHLFSPLFVVYPLWLKYLGIIKNKIIVCPRGALYDSALSVKWYKKKPFLLLFKWLKINKNVIFHATNVREKEAIDRFFPSSKILIADNLPRTVQNAWRSCEKESGKLRCIFIARIVPIKNLSFLLEVLKKVKGNVHLSIVGPIEDEGYWNSCKQIIESLPVNIRTEYLGSIANEKLADLINNNHLFILPTTGENFGHSIFEALLVGRPVLISDQTPWLNLTAEKTGWDLPLSKPEQFLSVIEEVANWDQNTFNEWAKSAWDYANFFIQNPSLKQNYLELFS